MALIGEIIEERYRIESLTCGLEISYICEGIDLLNGNRPVTIKLFKREAILDRPENMIRLNSELSKTSSIKYPGIVQVRDSGYFREFYFIITDSISGISLREFFKRGKSFTIDEAIDRIGEIALILKAAHNKGLIIRTLSPDSLFIDDKGTIRLVNYSYSSFLDVSIAISSRELSTALSYISPEVCGFLKRQIDRQCDLYSLGAILYMMLTAHPPLVYDQISPIINNYLTTSIIPPSHINNLISEELDRINLKLLKREPEDRYHSVAGFLADITRFKQGEKAFRLGEEDSKSPLSFRTSLMGRRQERSLIIEKFEEARKGKGSICLISGEPGLGKTRLVEEIKEELSGRETLFLRGKCYKESNASPYLPFSEALSDFSAIYSLFSNEKKSRAIESINKSTGGLGEIILRLNPVMESIIGPCPPMIKLDKERENKRFLIGITYFFYHLSQIEGTLVLFLDDLHWIDRGSLELLGELMQELTNYPVLIIGTYRNDEVDDEHILTKFISRYRSSRGLLTSILLNPLNSAQMDSFISELLTEEREQVKELSAFVLKGSKGNPLFALEIIKQLINEKALYQRQESWHINKKRLDKVVISDQLLELIIERTGLLNSKELEVMQYAAVIGSIIELDLLFSCYLNYPDSILMEQDVINVIDKAVKLQFLEESPNDKSKVIFSHDKIKEAFYKSIERPKLVKLHRRIASTIENFYQKSIPELVYELLHHYRNVGDEEKILEYGFRSGIKAQRSYANNEAIKYFEIVLNLLTSDTKLKNIRHEMKLRETLSELYLLVGQVDRAIEFLHNLLEHERGKKRTSLKSARLYKLLIQAYKLSSDWANCERYAAIGLGKLSEKLPTKKPTVALSIAGEVLSHYFYNLVRDISFNSLNAKEDEKRKELYKTVVDIYYYLTKCYFITDLVKVVRTTLRMINISEQKIGSSNELGSSLIAMGALYMALPKFEKAKKYYTMALELNKKLDNSWGIGQSYINLGLYYQWAGSYRQSIDYFLKSQEINRNIGDYGELGYGVDLTISSYLFMGDYDNTEKAIKQTMALAKMFNNNQGICTCYYNLLKLNTERGSFSEGTGNGEKALRFARENNLPILECITIIDLGILKYEEGETEESIDYLESARVMLEKNRFLPQYSLHLYTALAESYLAAAPSSNHKAIKRNSKIALKRSKRWPTHYGGALRAYARYQALKGDKKSASRLFQRSIEHCRRQERRFELAKSHYYYGIFYNNNREKALAREQWQRAYEIFNEIGAEAYKIRAGELLKNRT